MSPKKKEKYALPVVILWHHHQPYYKNSSGIFQMPWVRFHSTKDYLDLLLVLKEYPEIKQNYNLVPSLLSQIQNYTKDGVKDSVWELSEKPADMLEPEDKKKILSHFFQINTTKMIKPYPGYYELYLKIKDILKEDSIDRFLNYLSTDEYRDLQVWYNLAWIGIESRKKASIKKLFQKEKKFRESDKKILFKETHLIMNQLVGMFKQLWEKDQIEISTSPFYHPIIPLLCDNYIGRESSQSIPLPQKQFVFPEDAENQIEMGLDYIEKLFGKRPRGMWPSEGSVSMESMEIIARQGVQWAATDEGILANTLKEKFTQTHIYQPYLLDTGKNSINLFFRDHYLSDAIGFVYSNWPYEQAVSDFTGRLHAIRNLVIEKKGVDALSQAVVPVILDGENCWEYYEADGKPFLHTLYQTLQEDELLETVTFSEIVNRNKNPERINSIFPGSWINSNFNIWIGSEEDNKSWDILAATRQFLVRQQGEGIHSEEKIKQAWEKIYIAEGSDWNWWYGEEHSSANDMEFDQLYREHLMEVYYLLDSEIPAVLYQTIKRIHFDRFKSSMPKNFINPVLDGWSTHFYEWVGAAYYEIGNTYQSSMHQVARILNALYVGFNEQNLFIRLDFTSKPDPLSEFVIAIKRPKNITIVLSPLRGILEKFEMEDEVQAKTNLKPTFKMNKILEVAIPFQDLNIQAGEMIGFQILAKLNGKLLEEYPRMNLIELTIPDENYDLTEWSV